MSPLRIEIEKVSSVDENHKIKMADVVLESGQGELRGVEVDGNEIYVVEHADDRWHMELRGKGNEVGPVDINEERPVRTLTAQDGRVRVKASYIKKED